MYLHTQRQCAHSRDAQRDGTCECDVCQCPSNSVHYNRTCLHEVSLAKIHITKRLAMLYILEPCSPMSIGSAGALGPMCTRTFAIGSIGTLHTKCHLAGPMSTCAKVVVFYTDIGLQGSSVIGPLSRYKSVCIKFCMRST